MAGDPQPLTNLIPIVNAMGCPNEYFIRWAQQRQIDISQGITAQQAQQLIDDWAAARQIIAGTGLSGGGFLSADVTINLDAALGDLNDVDFSTPPTNGQALIYDSGTSTWKPGAGGGGGGGQPWWWSPPTAATYTLVSGDATNLALTDDTDIGMVAKFNSATVTGDIMRAAYETITSPSADWSYEVRMQVAQSAANFSTAGIFIRNPANGRILVYGWGNTGQMFVERRTLTAYSATAITVTRLTQFDDIFYKVSYVASSSTLIFWVSTDAKYWIRLGTELVSAYLAAAPSQIGFSINTALAGNTDDFVISVGRRVKSW